MKRRINIRNIKSLGQRAKSISRNHRRNTRNKSRKSPNTKRIKITKKNLMNLRNRKIMLHQKFYKNKVPVGRFNKRLRRS